MGEENFITAQFFVGLFLTWLFAILVNNHMAKLTKSIDFSVPKGINAEDWKNAFTISEERRKPNIVIGFLEATFFFVSFYSNMFALIGGWLTFKLASKWQTWNAIVKIPEKLDDKSVDQIQYIGAKNQIAWFTLQRWLLGTLGNIVAGLFGVILSTFFVKILILIPSISFASNAHLLRSTDNLNVLILSS